MSLHESNSVLSVVRDAFNTRSLDPAHRMQHISDALQVVSSLADGLRVMGNMAGHYRCGTMDEAADVQVAFELIKDVADIVRHVANSADDAIELMATAKQQSATSARRTSSEPNGSRAQGGTA